MTDADKVRAMVSQTRFLQYVEIREAHSWGEEKARSVVAKLRRSGEVAVARRGSVFLIGAPENIAAFLEQRREKAREKARAKWRRRREREREGDPLEDSGGVEMVRRFVKAGTLPPPETTAANSVFALGAA